MAEGADFTLNTQLFRKAVEKVPKLLFTSLKYGFQIIGDDFEKAMAPQFGNPLSGKWKRQPAPDKLANRTGNLQRSQRQVVSGTNLGNLKLRATIGNALTKDYASIQETGGTIRPKKPGGFLTIPMPKNLTGAGRVRVKNPKGKENIFLLRKGSRAFLVRKSTSAESGLEFLFTLKKQVKIPARLGFNKTWNSRKFQNNIVSTVQKRMVKALDVAGLLE